MPNLIIALGSIGLLGAVAGTAGGADVDGVIDFNRDIRPILANACFQCHGPDSASLKADLRLDREDNAKEIRDDRAAIVPGRPEDSELIRRITSNDPDERMPPARSGKTLDVAEIELLTRWIAQDAPWSLPWTYVPPRRHDLPQVNQHDWPLNWVDQFILARLELRGVEPAPEADKATLIRRLSIDLTGLPPPPGDVSRFVNDRRPDAYERLVDQLLGSPHYGERMAEYWLDLVRYADTVGYHGDQEHSSSPYRDYVIAAFNDNLPFDQFTREQLAGDLLDHPTPRQTIATAYNRLLQTTHEGGLQPKEYLAIYAADRVRNLSAVWMGATLGCAQCHDHKFDPYTTKDFYAMQAFFADVDEERHFKDGRDDQRMARRLPEIELPTTAQCGEMTALATRLQELDGLQSDKSSAEMAASRQKLKNLQHEIRRCMVTVAIEPRTIRILPRGNWMDASGPVVEPAIPEFLGTLPVSDRRTTRLDLAKWLTDSQNGAGGLTARVMVNRLWYLMLGRGLSRTLDEFGGQGEPPTHPELLDTLAVDFVDQGWDIKRLLKVILTSRVYRQSSIETPELHERDPLNELFARQAQFRFPAETIRDSALSISGLLVDQQGGDSVRPYQPAGYYRHLNFPEREYEAHVDDRQWRRGVYVHWQRQYLHPMLKAFDAPSREECTAERSHSNTAAAALVLLNDPTMVEAARVFAARILVEGGNSFASRLDCAFQLALSRSPGTEELRGFAKLLREASDYYEEHPEEGAKLLTVGLARTPSEISHANLAAWTIVARTLLSLAETTTRS